MDSTNENRGEAAGASGARLWAFRLASAIALPALLLLLVEGALRLTGVGHPGTFTAPCTVEGRAAFCDNAGFTRQFFPPGAFRLPPSLAIPAEKPPGTFRVFVVGESAAMGDPEPAYGVVRYLEEMLRARHPGVRFEVVNAAVTAVNSHVLLPMVRDLARRQPDVFVLYMGNNEVVGYAGTSTVRTPRFSSLTAIRAAIWLRSTRLGQLVDAAAALRGRGGGAGWRGMEMFLDQQVREDDPGLARVRENFGGNVRDIIAAARGSGARVVVSTVAVNLRNCGPFASLHWPGQPAPDLEAWQARYRAGNALEEKGRPAEALAEYRAAAAIDGSYAELQFRTARCLSALGESAAARAAFERARDLDTLRFRADGALDRILREEARAAGPGVELVDGEAAVDAASPGGVPGRDLFYEHVHLRPEGNYALALALLPAVEAALPGARGGAAPAPSQAECDRALALTRFDRRRIAVDVLARLQRPPFTNEVDHAEQLTAARAEAEAPIDPPAVTEAQYRLAIARAPRDPVLLFGLGRLLEERSPERAEPLLRAVVDLLPTDYEARDKLASALVRLGRFEEAAAVCREQLRRMPDHRPAHLTLAYVLVRQGDLDASVAEYGRAARLARESAPAAYNEIGRIELARGRLAAAAAAFRRGADLDPDGPMSADLLFNLSQALRKLGKAEEAAGALSQAISAYRRDLAGASASRGAHFGLASALAQRGDLAGAAAEFRAAAEADPGDVQAHLGLVRALEAQGRLAEAAEAARRGGAALEADGFAADAAALRRRAAELEARKGR